MDFPILIIRKSPFLFKGTAGVIFLFFFSFFDENHVSKQERPRWYAEFCGVASWAILFEYVP